MGDGLFWAGAVIISLLGHRPLYVACREAIWKQPALLFPCPFVCVCIRWRHEVKPCVATVVMHPIQPRCLCIPNSFPCSPVHAPLPLLCSFEATDFSYHVIKAHDVDRKDEAVSGVVRLAA